MSAKAQMRLRQNADGDDLAAFPGMPAEAGCVAAGAILSFALFHAISCNAECRPFLEKHSLA
jgi:hypothetical protein